MAAVEHCIVQQAPISKGQQRRQGVAPGAAAPGLWRPSGRQRWESRGVTPLWQGKAPMGPVGVCEANCHTLYGESVHREMRGLVLLHISRWRFAITRPQTARKEDAEWQV